VAVAVECQLCKHEVLGSNPNPTKKKKINKKKKIATTAPEPASGS
jgi:hypothetical protein